MIFEIAPPNSFLGKSIGELELRNRYHIEVIAVKDVLTDQIHMVPAANFILKDGEILVVIAKEKDIQKIK
jgi:trk system potassium uptake protein TrkA